MGKILSLLLLCVTCQASTVHLQLTNWPYLPPTNTLQIFQTQPTISGNYLVYGNPIRIQYTNSAIYTNFFPGVYELRIIGFAFSSPILFPVPDCDCTNELAYLLTLKQFAGVYTINFGAGAGIFTNGNTGSGQIAISTNTFPGYYWGTYTSGSGGSATNLSPWTSVIDGGGFSLLNAKAGANVITNANWATTNQLVATNVQALAAIVAATNSLVRTNDQRPINLGSALSLFGGLWGFDFQNGSILALTNVNNQAPPLWHFKVDSLNTTELSVSTTAFIDEIQSGNGNLTLDAETVGDYITVGTAAGFLGSFFGSGAGITTLNASQLSSGTVADARLSANVALRSVDFQRLTNSGTKTITFNYTNRVTISDISTNASFTWDAAVNVSPTNYQTSIYYVYNTGGGIITMTPPPGVILLGTANVTNGGYTVVSWAQNGLKNTNGMSLPFK